MGQMAQAMWASAQMLAFRDCFLAVGIAFLSLIPVVFLLPGRGDRRNFTDRVKQVLTLIR
jgi:hypothetical protein